MVCNHLIPMRMHQTFPFVGKYGRGHLIYTALQKGVKDDGGKVALLLHTGGMDLQVYYTLAGEDAALSYDDSIKLLDDHFVSSVSI